MGNGYINADEALKTRSEIEILTSGTSMRPMLRRHRDIVVIERVCRKLKKGDVPLYRKKGKKDFVLHRILKVTDGGYVIRGDNLFNKEYDVKDEDIIGVLKAFYRNGRYVDCATNKFYKFYVWLNRTSYPLRWFYRFIFLPLGVRVKHIFVK